MTKNAYIEILLKDLRESGQFGEVSYKEGEGIILSLYRLIDKMVYATITEDEIDYQTENWEDEIAK